MAAAGVPVQLEVFEGEGRPVPLHQIAAREGLMLEIFDEHLGASADVGGLATLQSKSNEPETLWKVDSQRIKPTFLGIGSARCGSTWLHRALNLHPDIQMSDPKQLEFFNKTMLRHDGDWYCNFFKPASGEEPRPVRGEVTPFYSRLHRGHVENIRSFLPGMKIVLTIRNPVDRIWSNAKLDFAHFKNRQLENMSTGSFVRFGQRARTRRYTDYASIIDRWSDVFGPDAVHVEVFDDIKQAPGPMLKRIFGHIGANPSWEPPAELIQERVLPEGSDRQVRDMPEEMRWALSMDWVEKTRRLNDRLDGRISNWVSDMEAASAGARPGWRLRRILNRTVLSLPEKVAYTGYDLLKTRQLDRRWKLILGA